VYVDGRRVVAPSPVGRKIVQIHAPQIQKSKPLPVDMAVNLLETGFPSASASVNNTPDALHQAIDGRIWFYPEMPKYWTTAGSQAGVDWFSLDFGTEKLLSSVALYFYDDGTQYKAPATYVLQYWTGQAWSDIPNSHKTPATPLGDGENTVTFRPMKISKLRAVFANQTKSSTALVALKVF
jgi:hypothetical protein